MSRLRTAIFTSLFAFSVPVGFADAQTTTRVSIAPDGKPWSKESNYPSVSADGRYVAFQASEFTWNPGGWREYTRWNVYLRDTQTGTTKLISRGLNGAEADGDSTEPTISADGRHVAFQSLAANLVPFDLNRTTDVFVWDRDTESLTCASMSMTGGPGNGYSYRPKISASGRYVAFGSLASNLVNADPNGNLDVFVRDLQTQTTECASIGMTSLPGNSHSYTPSVSADGRYVAFESLSTNLTPGGVSNNVMNIFVRDRQKQVTHLVSQSTSGVAANKLSSKPVISANGRYVVFYTKASNLVNNDTNGANDVFLRDIAAGTTTRVSVADDGAQGSYDSWWPVISEDGRYVAFLSSAASMVAGEPGSGWWTAFQVVVRDRVAGTTRRVSRAPNGAPINSGALSLNIGNDGRFVVFHSQATNLVPDVTDDTGHVFRTGPLDAPPGAFTMAEAALALKIAAGLRAATAAEYTRLNVEAGTPGRVDLRDAIRIARKAAGTQANP